MRVDGDGEVVVVDGRDVHDVDGDVDDGGALRQLEPLVVGRQAEAGHAAGQVAALVPPAAVFVSLFQLSRLVYD